MKETHVAQGRRAPHHRLFIHAAAVLLGSLGGKARVAATTKNERRVLAKLAANTRWGNQ